MENSPQSPKPNSSSRAEKLSLLRSLLGHETVARLNAEHEREAPAPGTEAPLDPDRAAWHRNKLLERLRDRAPAQGTNPAKNQQMPRSATPANRTRNMAPINTSVDVRLAAAANFETLSGEHPAVIARLLGAMAREDRVAALKKLPGPVARTVLRRMR